MHVTQLPSKTSWERKCPSRRRSTILMVWSQLRSRSTVPVKQLTGSYETLITKTLGVSENSTYEVSIRTQVAKQHQTVPAQKYNLTVHQRQCEWVTLAAE